MSESSEESEDPLYGEDSSLTEGASSDEYSSDELRRRVVCSGSSSSTGADSSESSESYDEDDSDPEVINFTAGKTKGSSVGFKATPHHIETFLKADPILNGSDIFKGQVVEQSSQKIRTNTSGQQFEWSTSESSDEDFNNYGNSGLTNRSHSTLETTRAQKSKDYNDLTVAFSVQETIKASQQLFKKGQEDPVEDKKANAKTKARAKTSTRKPSSTVKLDVSSDDKLARKPKPKSLDNRTSQDLNNLLNFRAKTQDSSRTSNSPTTEKAGRNEKNLVKNIQGRGSNYKTVSSSTLKLIKDAVRGRTGTLSGTRKGFK